LQDRSKDVIISGGTNIYPREVEEVLLTHPQVHEVSVVGKPSTRNGARMWSLSSPMIRPGEALSIPRRSTHSASTEIARFKRPKAYFERERSAEEQLRQGAQNRIAREPGREMTMTDLQAGLRW
jgi:acyl-CoA synthetase (AMP-forming)/AMP-acid ligase II